MRQLGAAGGIHIIVEVTLLGVFKEAFGSEHTSLTVEPSRRLREIITRLTESSHALERVMIDPELHDPQPNAVMLVNGKEAGVLEGLETEVKEGDRIVLIPVAHGG